MSAQSHFGARVGDAQSTHLCGCQHPNFNPLNVKDFIGKHLNPRLGRATDVGGKVWEMGQRYYLSQAFNFGVILVVARADASNPIRFIIDTIG